MTSMPPARTTSTSASASAADSARTTGTTPILEILSRVALFISLPGHAGAAALHQLFDFGQCGHAGIPRGRHGERAVRGATFDRPFGILSRQKSIDEPGC